MGAQARAGAVPKAAAKWIVMGARFPGFRLARQRLVRRRVAGECRGARPGKRAKGRAQGLI